MTKLDFEAPERQRGPIEDAAMPYSPESARGSARAAHMHEATLMAIDGVEGVGQGQDSIGNEAIIVYVRDQGTAKLIPRELAGVSVIVEVTGQVRPQL